MTSDLHPLPACVAALADAEFGAGSRALGLLQIALERDEYDREIALPLLRAARGLDGEMWAERRLAVLLLENQVLRLHPSDLAEFDFLLVTLGLKEQTGFEIPLHSRVLLEGYSTVRLEGFVAELAARLRRLNRVHQSIRNADSVEVAWSYFLRSSRDDSKLTLARYVFGAAEVAEQIARSLVVSDGAESTLSRSRETPAAIDAPEYEAEILNRLCADRADLLGLGSLQFGVERIGRIPADFGSSGGEAARQRLGVRSQTCGNSWTALAQRDPRAQWKRRSHQPPPVWRIARLAGHQGGLGGGTLYPNLPVGAR